MNRLFRKGGDEAALPAVDLAAPTYAASPQTTQLAPRRRWGRKKPEHEHTPTDVPFVLPPTDNFRTSLIMPGLSTRFSMLREADDPFSLIGKASDDSVMPPSHPNYLHDIAEVSSLRAHSFRPPFADSDRKTSYTSDGYATDDDDHSSSAANGGSIMSRARPGEGNNLFGGRQKIYKIPVGDSGAVNTLGGGESRGMRGRALYEDDISMSAFQRLRWQERQVEQERIKSDHADNDDSNDSLTIAADDDRRHTASSTNSGPSMLSAASTTATSTASPGPSPSNASSQAPSPNPSGFERSKFGSKRLYESKLDQHQQESQLANVSRLNSIQRRNPQNHPGQRFLQTSNSNQDLRQPRDRSASGPNPITELPSDEGLTTFDSIRQARNPSPNPSRNRFNSPTIDEVEDPLSEAISTADRGKATALGAFNRPKQQFDEQQYLRRQQSLMQQQAEGRSPSGSARPSVDRSRPSFDNRSDLSRQSADTTRPSVDSSFRPPFARADHSFSSSSLTQAGSRPGSSRSAAPSASSSPAKVRRGAPAAPPAAPAPPPPVPAALPAQRNVTPGSWPDESSVGGDAQSDDGDEPEDKAQHPTNQSLPRISLERGEPADVPQPLRRTPPPMFEHPALRAAQEAPKTLREKRSGWSSDVKFANFRIGEDDDDERPRANRSEPEPSRESTPAPSEEAHPATDLSAMRAHMRTVSESSSVYPTPDLNNYNFDDEEPVPALPSFHDTLGRDSLKSIPGAQARPGADSKHSSTAKELPTLPDSESPNPGNFNLAEWEQELSKRHSRNDSGTTQAERDAFADELAQRQRAIRENLKIKVENSSGATSPSGSKNSNVFESSLRPFGLLRKSSGRDTSKPEDNLRSRLDKAKNISATDLSSSTANGPHSPAPIGRTLHSRMPAPRQSEEQTRQARQRSRPRQNSLASDATRDDSLARSYRAPTESKQQLQTRDRSVSGQSADRSFSRPRNMSAGRNHAFQGQDFNLPEEESGPQPRNRSGSAMSSRQAGPKSSVEILGIRGSNSDSSSEATSTNTSLDRPNIHVDTHSSASRSNAASPITEASGTTPTSTSSSGFPRGEGGTVAGGSYGGSGSRTLPPAAFTFPVRTAAQRAQKRPTQHSKTVLKSDISEPTLLSSTSNVDMVSLPPGASLANGATSDVDAVLAAQQAAAGYQDQGGIVLASVPVGPIHPATSSVGTPNSSALSPSDRTSSATATTASSDPGRGSGASGRKSPPIGLITAEKGPVISSTSPPPLPPPIPDTSSIYSGGAGSASGKKRAGFSFFKRSNGAKSGPSSPNEQSDNGSSDAKEAAFDDFVLRPSGGRLRIRKVSDETLGMGGRRRHQLVAAPDDEEGDAMAGGMI